LSYYTTTSLYCQPPFLHSEKLKVDGDFGIPGEKGLKGGIFDRETESGKRNLERFPLYNYLKR